MNSTAPIPPRPARGALTNAQVIRATLVVLLGFFASGVLGFVRINVYSVTFGAGDLLDAFYAAQRIPELVYTLVAGGALGSSFIPVFSRFFEAGDDAGAWRLASAVMTCTTLLAGGFALIIGLFAHEIVPRFLVPDAAPEMQALTTDLTRLLIITVLIFTISGLVMGILNARQIFLGPALALVANNLGLIFGALALAPFFSIYGLVYGAILGALLHLAVQLPGLRRAGARLRFLPDLRTPGAFEVLRLMGPRVLGLAAVQINFLVNVVLTSGMLPGSRTVFTTAWMLMFFALGVIAQSVGTAVFPTLSALAAAGDMAGYRDRLSAAMRGVLFLALPVTALIIVLGAPAIRLLLEYGAWTAESTAGAAWALTFFALGIAGHSLLEVLSRAFYALADTRTPVTVGIISVALNIALSLILMRVIGSPESLSRGTFAGLALANSIATLLEGAALWILLRRRIGRVHDRVVLASAGKTLFAAVGLGLAAQIGAAIGGRIAAGWPTPLNALAQLIFGGGLGVAVFLILALLLRIDEARTVPRALLRRFSH